MYLAKVELNEPVKTTGLLGQKLAYTGFNVTGGTIAGLKKSVRNKCIKIKRQGEAVVFNCNKSNSGGYDLLSRVTSFKI